MTTLSVEGEVPSFLDLAWECLSCMDYDCTDRQNNTPLHAFVKAPNCATSKKAEIVLKSLLAKGCLSQERDLRGKMPHEYLPASHQFHKTLLSATQSPGEGVVHRLEEIRKRSNEALVANNFIAALDGYTMALKIAEKFPRSLKEEKAILYSNMAAVHLKKEEPKEALAATEKSLRNNAGFVKSYLRQGQAYSKLKKYAEACKSFMQGFDATSNQQEEIKFCIEAVLQVSKLSGESARPILVDLRPKLVSVWSEVLAQLTREGNWSEVNTLLSGPPKFSDDLGVMAGYLCRTAELKTICNLSPRVKFDVGRLMLILLERQADFASLAVSEKDTPFHALTRLSMHNVLTWDDFGCICDLLKSGNLFPIETVCPDGEGRSLLHAVCLESLTLPESDHVAMSFTLLLSIREQLGWSLDPNSRDKYGKRPVDYCKPGSRMHSFVTLVSNDYASQQPSSSKTKPASEKGSKGGASKKSSSSYSSAQSTSSILKWEDLKVQGNKAYSNLKYEQALKLYTQAISTFERDLRDAGQDLKSLPDSTSHDLAVLYGNCAECHCHLGNSQAFFENARQNVNYDGLWFKGHYRIGRACLLLDEPQLALQAFVNSYKYLPAERDRGIQTSILECLVDAAFHLKAQKKQAGDWDVAALLKSLPRIPGEVRTSLALQFIRKGTFEFWKKAEFAFGLPSTSGSAKYQESSLGIFCQKELLSRQGWICSLILQIANLKDLLPTLKFHPRDRYLHAALTLIVATGSSPAKHPDTIALLKVVIDFAKARKELDQQDMDGNTGLH
ncbi:hypothetical protein EGW08_004097, partial [Elysia chlorotica]